MTRATQDEITQMAREAVARQYETSEASRRAAVCGDYLAGSSMGAAVEAARAAILATLAKYAPDKLPADPDEELARKLAGDWLKERGVEGGVNSLALYVIKHMREKQA